MDEQKANPRELNKETAWLLRNIGISMYEALNGSMAAAEMLSRRLERPEQDEEREFLAVMRHDQYRLLRIAENLTELGSIALGEALPGAETVDLNEVCDSLQLTLSRLLDGPELLFTPTPSVCAVTGTQDRVEKLVLNLLAFSLERCRDGGRVRLRTERSGDTVYLILQDDCVMGEELSIEALYAALERDPMRVRDRGGAGLGLLTADSTARLLGGSLLLSEEPGKGLEAVLTLPVSRTTHLRLPRPSYGHKLRGILTILAELLTRDKYMAPYL